MLEVAELIVGSLRKSLLPFFFPFLRASNPSLEPLTLLLRTQSFFS